MSYKAVKDAMENGALPEMLCGTCPWDRYCITPPTMSSAEVKALQTEAEEKDRAETEAARLRGEEPKMPMGSLMTAMVFAGKDEQATLCPVFSARLRSSQGRVIADGFKTQMTNWDDEAV